MSEMSRAQTPAGGDANPDPTDDLVPPAAVSEPPVQSPEVPSGESGGGTGTPEAPSGEPVLDTEGEGPDPNPEAPLPAAGGGVSAGTEASSSSDPMPDMAGTDPS